jgi:hypothetical protein
MPGLRRSDSHGPDPALAPAGAGRVRPFPAAGMPAWLPPVALSAALAAVLLVWDPHVRDLAAQMFRAELFERDGFVLWNGSWYQGHYTLTYSVLFPPLAALLGTQLVGALSAVASAYLFDRIVREHWGERARWATLWFGAGAATMLATGRVTFSLGVAFGLAALRALQRARTLPAIAAAGGCALSSPVAAVFLSGVTIVGALVTGGRVSRPALAVGAVAAVPIVLLNVVFPDEGRQPFSFAAFLPVALYGAVVLYLTRGLAEERRFRLVVVAYVLATAFLWLIPNPLGNNAVRLASLFGGPLLLAVMLARRPRVPMALAVVILAASAFWQLLAPARDLLQSAGDASTSASYYEELESWLRVHGGTDARIEVPMTLNTWEATYLAPEFQLARGWLGQLDRDRNAVFYEGRLTDRRYRRWLERNGVRYVALPDAPLQQSARPERRLIRDDPAYLEPRWSSAHWRVYEVADPKPLVQGLDGARGELVSLTPDSFTLRIERPGMFRVLVRGSPFWELAHRGHGCVGRQGKWTTVRLPDPGTARVEVSFSMASAWRSASSEPDAC